MSVKYSGICDNDFSPHDCFDYLPWRVNNLDTHQASCKGSLRCVKQNNMAATRLLFATWCSAQLVPLTSPWFMISSMKCVYETFWIEESAKCKCK